MSLDKSRVRFDYTVVMYNTDEVGILNDTYIHKAIKVPICHSHDCRVCSDSICTSIPIMKYLLV